MKTYKTLAFLLLIFNGTGAIYGGWNLMQYPDGSSLQLSPVFLLHSPFNSYFIPGVILFIANGVFSFLVIGLILFNSKIISRFITAQGIILTCWIIIQILMIHIVYFLHYILASAGLLLIFFGWRIGKTKNTQA